MSIKTLADELMALIKEELPECEARAQAIHRLRESIMWIGEATHEQRVIRSFAPAGCPPPAYINFMSETQFERLQDLCAELYPDQAGEDPVAFVTGVFRKKGLELMKVTFDQADEAIRKLERTKEQRNHTTFEDLAGLVRINLETLARDVAPNPHLPPGHISAWVREQLVEVIRGLGVDVEWVDVYATLWGVTNLTDKAQFNNQRAEALLRFLNDETGKHHALQLLGDAQK